MKKLKEAVTLLTGLGIVMLFTGFSGIGCPIKWLTGISCAGCGMTRAVFYAMQLQFKKAFYYHPLFWMLPLFIILYFFWEKIPSKAQKGITWTAISCFAGVYFFRLFHSDNVVVSIHLETGLFVRLWRYFT